MLGKIDRLLAMPCSIIDIFPYQVPKTHVRQYLDVEDYFFQPEELHAFARKIVCIVLKLSCYYDMEVYYNGQPSDDAIAELISATIAQQKGTIQIILGDALLQINGGDLYATVYHADEALLSLLHILVTAEGLFLRSA